MLRKLQLTFIISVSRFRSGTAWTYRRYGGYCLFCAWKTRISISHRIVLVCGNIPPSAGLHISLSIRCFSLICCNILYPDETGNGALTWCLNPRQVYYGQTGKSADGGGRYSSQDKEHHRPPAFMDQEDCSCFCGWCLGIIELSSQDVWTRALTEPRGPTENREYTETYGQPSVLAPFPSTAKSLPQDWSLSDKSGQLSLSFIPTDTSAPPSDEITWTASAAALSRGFGDLRGAVWLIRRALMSPCRFINKHSSRRLQKPV